MVIYTKFYYKLIIFTKTHFSQKWEKWVSPKGKNYNLFQICVYNHEILLHIKFYQNLIIANKNMVFRSKCANFQVPSSKGVVCTLVPHTHTLEDDNTPIIRFTFFLPPH